MWLIVLQNKGLVDWIFLFCLNFFYRNDTTTLNNNWRVVEGKHDNYIGRFQKISIPNHGRLFGIPRPGGGGGGSLNWKSGGIRG